MAPKECTISSPNGLIRLRDTGGEGMPIVMLHGSASSLEVFGRQFADPALAHRRLVALDLPGHGRSSDAADPERDYTLKGVADAVAHALAAAGIDRAVLFGWSLGGHVALQLAATTTLAAGLMLSGAPPVSLGPLGLLRGFHPSWDILLASKRQFTERDVGRFARLCFGEDFDPAFLPTITRADGRLRVHFFRSLMHGDGADQRGFVERNDVPVALINGALDPFVRLNYLETIAFAHLWRNRSHLIPATGHASFWHAPQLFNPLLNSFARDADAYSSQKGTIRRTA